MNDQFDIAVIGTGPGGYIAALKAANMNAKVAVIEKHHLGGTCLNYGCIPSKALLASAELMHKISNAADLGVKVSEKTTFDWPFIQKRKDKVLKKLRGGIGGLFAAQNVTLLKGTGSISSKGTIEVTGEDGSSQTISAKKTIIAVGSEPVRIPGWPDDNQYVCTSDEALHWDELPEKLLIVGGGVIGCEFACMMHEYGVEVTLIEMMDRILPEMEPELGSQLAEIFTRRGIKILTGLKVESLETKDGTVTAQISDGKSVVVDKILTAVGRKPNTAGIGLEKVGIKTDRGFIRVDSAMQTEVEDYYCIGDANGRCLLAHAASAQGVTAVRNALGQVDRRELPVPNAVYTFPEAASVGITSRQAKERDIPVRIGKFPIGYLGKAMAVGEETGFVKVISHFETDELLGVHIIGHNATEIIESATAMMTVKAKAADLGEMIFAHPTIGEAVKEAAEDLYLKALHLPPSKASKMMADL